MGDVVEGKQLFGISLNFGVGPIDDMLVVAHGCSSTCPPTHHAPPVHQDLWTVPVGGSVEQIRLRNHNTTFIDLLCNMFQRTPPTTQITSSAAPISLRSFNVVFSFDFFWLRDGERPTPSSRPFALPRICGIAPSDCVSSTTTSCDSAAFRLRLRGGRPGTRTV